MDLPPEEPYPAIDNASMETPHRGKNSIIENKVECKETIARVREILGSMKERRDLLSAAVAHSTTSSSKHGPLIRDGEDVLPYMLTRRTNPFSGQSSSESITQQISRSLQERQERLARILAGLDPDTGSQVTEEEKKEEEDRVERIETSARPIVSYQTNEQQLTPTRTEPTAVPPTGSVFRRFGRQKDVANMLKRPRISSNDHHKPPTLEEIREAFNSPTDTTMAETSSICTRSTATDAKSFRQSTHEEDPRQKRNSIAASIETDENKTGARSLQEQQQLLPSEAASSGIHRSADGDGAGVKKASSFDYSMVSSKTPCVRRVVFSFDAASQSQLGLSSSSLPSKIVPEASVDTRSILDSSSFHPTEDTPHTEHSEQQNLESIYTSLSSTSVSSPSLLRSSLDDSSSGLPETVTSCSLSRCTGVRLVYSFDDSKSSTAEARIKDKYSIRRTFSYDIRPPEMLQPPTCEDLKLPDRLNSTLADQQQYDPYPTEVIDGRPGTPFSPSSSDDDGEDDERALYIGNLYLGQNYPPNKTCSELDEPRSKGRILGLSVIVDDEKKQALLLEESSVSGSEDLSRRPLHFVSTGPKRPSSQASSITHSHLDDDDSVIISDASSLDLTNDTNTSGWISVSERELDGVFEDASLSPQPEILESDAYLLDSKEDDACKNLLAEPKTTEVRKTKHAESIPERVEKSSKPPTPPTLKTTKTAFGKGKIGESTKTKRVAFVGLEKPSSCTAAKRKCHYSSKTKKRILFVSEQVSDAQSQSNSSLYAIAISSGLDLDKELAEVRVKRSTAPPKFLRLNSDFRCGAKGSMYDIAQRSGFDLATPWEWKKKRKFLVARGGLFDLAARSGLTPERLRSRVSFTIETKPLSPSREDDATVLPEDVTDYECGATGSLFLAFESGGGDYVSKGSLYYLAARSGMSFRG